MTSQPPVDLSDYCHFSSSRLAPLVPRILASGKVHAGKHTTPEQQAGIFFDTLRAASDGMVFPSMQTHVSPATYEEVGKLVFSQIPHRLRARVIQRVQENLDFQKKNFGPQHLAYSSPKVAQEHARHFQKALTRFGVDFGKPLSSRVGGVREEEPVLAGAR
jgi:hypothetical protein